MSRLPGFVARHVVFPRRPLRVTMLSVVQASFHADRLRRPPEQLLEAWPTLRETAAAVARAGCAVTVVHAARQTARIERDGVSYRFQRVGFFGARGSRWLAGMGGIISAVRDAAPDVLHVQSLRSPLQAALLARALPGIPMLAQDHADRPAHGVRRPLQRWGYRRLAGVAFTARTMAQPFFDTRILRPDVPVFEVIEGSTFFTPGEAAEIQGDPCVVWVGRLDENKDPLTVLAAVELAAAELPNLQLWCLYTDAPLEETVRRRVESSPKLAGRVHLRGALPRDKVEAHLRRADLFVLGSHHEGSGYALIEALACGATPVVSDIPPFRKITDGGSLGGLFPPGDAGAMARLLVAWTGKTDRRKVRRHFEQALSYDAIGRQLQEAYQALVKQP